MVIMPSKKKPVKQADKIVKPAKKANSKRVDRNKKPSKAAVGTNKYTSRALEEQNVDFPWLSNFEALVLGRGGYYDTEGVLHNHEGCIRCTAMVQSTGQRCKNFAVHGELTCNIHGGTLARAKAGKQRLYSAFIDDPTLAAVFENACNDDNKEINGLREELGLLRMLLAKVLRTSELDTAKEVKEVAGVIGEIRQLVDSCTKAELRLGQLVDISKIGLIMQQAAKIIMVHVKDEEVIKKIAADIDNIIIPNAGATTPQFEPVNNSGKVRELPTEIY
jgi:hypothetical protein